jgi:hypothetical protein
MSKTTDTHELLSYALLGYEQTKKEIDAKIAELRAQMEGTSAPAAVQESTPTGRRPLSAAARARMARAQRKRWAAKRKAQGSEGAVVAPPAKSVATKRVMSPEAKARIAAAQRKRWAAYKKAV